MIRFGWYGMSTCLAYMCQYAKHTFIILLDIKDLSESLLHKCHKIKQK